MHRTWGYRGPLAKESAHEAILNNVQQNVLLKYESHNTWDGDAYRRHPISCATKRVRKVPTISQTWWIRWASKPSHITYHNALRVLYGRTWQISTLVHILAAQQKVGTGVSLAHPLSFTRIELVSPQLSRSRHELMSSCFQCIPERIKFHHLELCRS